MENTAPLAPPDGAPLESPLTWASGGLALTVGVDDAGVARTTRVAVDGVVVAAPAAALPPAEVGVVGAGRHGSARRYVDSAAAARAVLRSAEVAADGAGLVLVSLDAATGLLVRTEHRALPGARALRTTTTLTNSGGAPVAVSWVTSLVLDGLLAGVPLERLELWWADNDWLAENRWSGAGLREVLPDVHRDVHRTDPRGAFGRTGRGSWSTDGSLPVGVLHDPGSDRALAWEVESPGGWHWQVGERVDGAYLSALGPTDAQHQWSVELAPGESFTTVPVTLAASLRGLTGAFAELTAARRATRRAHPDAALPVVFHSDGSGAAGSPTTEALLPLVAAAASAGADVFCLDADDVAAGVEDLLDAVRAAGMAPGARLEPELVAAGGALAAELPDAAFATRSGRRLVERGCNQLDLRHPAARALADAAVDRLVDGLGVTHLVLDHPVDAGAAGTDHDAASAGDGLLGHQRAHLAWLEGVLERHPEVVLESSASGGLRADQAVASRVHLLAGSDQRDPRRCPPIVAAAAAAVLPEQVACRVHLLPDQSDDAVVFTTALAVLGGVHLSGRLDLLDDHQLALVREGVEVHRRYRSVIPTATPFWPLGLPGWDDGWVAHGLQDDATGTTLVAVWRRGGERDEVVLDLPASTASAVAAPTYPRSTRATWSALGGGRLSLRLPEPWTAVVLELRAPLPG